MKTILLFISLFLTGIAVCQTEISDTSPNFTRYQKESPLVSFYHFATLADTVEKYREPRLVSAVKFVELSKEPNTIILDTRSREFFARKHVKGALNLPFADFTQGNLEALIPDKNTRILIYCNNNFMLDKYQQTWILDPDFVSKQGRVAIIPQELQQKDIENPIRSMNPDLKKTVYKSFTLALNIPTFINLYGYGYRNIYELQDIVSTANTIQFQFEGTSVDPNQRNLKPMPSEPSTLVKFSDLQELIDLVHIHRLERLISLDQFNQMKLEENTIILDTRSKEMYDAKHVKGAIHLEFSDFTQWTLDKITGKDPNKRILIYCNNNFITDLEIMEQDRYFMSKTTWSNSDFNEPINLALNIPTYINLYGYGFQNVFELNELVVTSDPRIQFEGTAVE